MTNTKSANKRIKINENKRKHNVSKKSMMKTFIKRTQNAINEKNKEKANIEFKQLQKILDKLVFKKIIHKNKAARHKSNLTIKIKTI
ncbi:30S ribosomal protein S20 [Candidatus Purcelliella pentastirinorum]|uniref:Small ribosomal subunit protein bS20 n=1 Tax=Candidatus Purcelliella pentastirinorum TaxID=472834 RepID=A0AAX3NAZ6_9ENTR|nr:30S ribosomal protein S20 [Candidatus Purcelliella pentastirinorum]WDI78666.1 30S ribosomal protein S20 [Candidatus Purcelliella pentastirinorum]WDR80723.1 30S ribosomal protein S20 [Candidatus Purcelliella pentastirinorum]